MISSIPWFESAFISSWKVFWFVWFVLKQTTRGYSLMQPIPEHIVTETNRFWVCQLIPIILCKPTITVFKTTRHLGVFRARAGIEFKRHYSCPSLMVQNSRVRTQPTALSLNANVQWHNIGSMRGYSDNKSGKFPFARRTSKETRVTKECADRKRSWEDTVQQVEMLDFRFYSSFNCGGFI